MGLDTADEHERVYREVHYYSGGLIDTIGHCLSGIRINSNAGAGLSLMEESASDFAVVFASQMFKLLLGIGDSVSYGLAFKLWEDIQETGREELCRLTLAI